MINDFIDSFGDKNIIRIYGNTLGTISDITDFLSAIEKNYLNILAYQKILYEMSSINLKKFISNNPLRGAYKYLYFDSRTRFLEYQRFYDIKDIVSSDENLIVSKINYNSPGFWEVMASWSPFEQIRKYIKDRHDRIRDKKYIWDMDKKLKEVEIETKQLNNDLLKIETIGTIITQLEKIGLSEIEIRGTIQKYYGELSLLNLHIDDERIIDIKKVDKDGNEI